MRDIVKYSKTGLVALLLGISVTAQAISDKKSAAIEERIKPVGSVCIEGDSSCGSVASAGSTGGGASKSGEDIYNTSCMACHSTGAAGAPKLGDAGDWGVRIDQGTELLYTNAINGINGMPAKGLCMTCSEDEIKATVDYMLEKLK